MDTVKQHGAQEHQEPAVMLWQGRGRWGVGEAEGRTG